MTIRRLTGAALALVSGIAIVSQVQAQPAPTAPGNTVPAPSVMPGNTTLPGNTAMPGNTVRPGNVVIQGNVVVPGNTALPGNAVRPGNTVTLGNTQPGERPGANSFTEGQARSRIEAGGFTGVSALVQDANGIWRGRAMRAGQSVQVSLDFQGNVTAQ